MRLAWALTAASVVWIVAIPAASSSGGGTLHAAVHAFASFICHQLPERSFAWGSHPWVVCARCLGLYAAAPAGAMAALAVGATRAFDASRNVRLAVAAGAPTLLTWLAEFVLGWPMSNAARFAAALPLGAAVAWLLVRTAIEARGRGVSQYTLKDARRGQTR